MKELVNAWSEYKRRTRFNDIHQGFENFMDWCEEHYRGL